MRDHRTIFILIVSLFVNTAIAPLYDHRARQPSNDDANLQTRRNEELELQRKREEAKLDKEFNDSIFSGIIGMATAFLISKLLSSEGIEALLKDRKAARDRFYEIDANLEQLKSLAHGTDKVPSDIVTEIESLRKEMGKLRKEVLDAHNLKPYKQEKLRATLEAKRATINTTHVQPILNVINTPILQLNSKLRPHERIPTLSLTNRLGKSEFDTIYVVHPPTTNNKFDQYQAISLSHLEDFDRDTPGNPIHKVCDHAIAAFSKNRFTRSLVWAQKKGASIPYSLRHIAFAGMFGFTGFLGHRGYAYYFEKKTGVPLNVAQQQDKENKPFEHTLPKLLEKEEIDGKVLEEFEFMAKLLLDQKENIAAHLTKNLEYTKSGSKLAPKVKEIKKTYDANLRKTLREKMFDIVAKDHITVKTPSDLRANILNPESPKFAPFMHNLYMETLKTIYFEALPSNSDGTPAEYLDVNYIRELAEKTKQQLKSRGTAENPKDNDKAGEAAKKPGAKELSMRDVEEKSKGLQAKANPTPLPTKKPFDPALFPSLTKP